MRGDSGGVGGGGDGRGGARRFSASPYVGGALRRVSAMLLCVDTSPRTSARWVASYRGQRLAAVAPVCGRVCVSVCTGIGGPSFAEGGDALDRTG